jgi:sRNA-binding protein
MNAYNPARPGAQSHRLLSAGESIAIAASSATPRPALTHRQRKRRAQRKAALTWLKSTWPHLFAEGPKPLAIGIGDALIAHAEEAGIRPYAVNGILLMWTRSRGYLEALATVGAVRWGLSGTAVDFVASEHQADARLKLAELKAARPKTLAAQAAS